MLISVVYFDQRKQQKTFENDEKSLKLVIGLTSTLTLVLKLSSKN